MKLSKHQEDPNQLGPFQSFVFMIILTHLLVVLLLQVTNACQSGLMFTLVDNRMGFYSSACVERFGSLAIQCCSDETDARPSMSEVVAELERIFQMLADDSSHEALATGSSKTVSSPSLLSESSGTEPLVSSSISSITGH